MLSLVDRRAGPAGGLGRLTRACPAFTEGGRNDSMDPSARSLHGTGRPVPSSVSVATVRRWSFGPEVHEGQAARAVRN